MNRQSARPGNKGAIIRRLVMQVLLLCYFLSVSEAASERVDVAILFPEVEGSYAKVFSTIIKGIEEHPRISSRALAIGERVTAQEVDSWLENQPAKSIIVLGQRAYHVATQSQTALPLVVGALVVPPDDHPTISMAGDPDAFFAHLKTLAPKVQRIFIVYSERDNGWLIRHAEVAAQEHGLELVAHAAADIREAVRYYRTVLETARSDTDAVWLPMDRIVPDETILPMALDAAWKRHLVVFASNPLYVKRGALFALYADYELMGREIADLAISHSQGNPKARAIPTRQLKLAVNQRTASHLGLHYSQSQQRSFDLIFPSPR